MPACPGTLGHSETPSAPAPAPRRLVKFRLVAIAAHDWKYTPWPGPDGRCSGVSPSSGVILPRGRQRITMDFVSNTVQEYRYKLVVDVEEVGTKVDSLDLLATCVVPEVSVSKDSIDFGQCFIGFPYPSGRAQTQPQSPHISFSNGKTRHTV